MTIKIKESTKPSYKISAIKYGWLDRVMKRKDYLKRTAQQLFDEHNIEIVHGSEKADFGLSMHGDPVQGVPRKKCVLLKGEPPIYNIYYGWKLCSQSYLNKFLAVMSVYEMEGLRQIHYQSPQSFYREDLPESYIERFFNIPKTKFLCLVLRNKKTSKYINAFHPTLRKYNKNSNIITRIKFDRVFCKVLGPDKYESHSLKGHWCKECFKGPITFNFTNTEYDPLYSYLSQYTFNFAPENSCFNGYITEKPIQAMMCGSVPIYLGAPDVDKYIPKGTFVDCRGYTPEEVCDLISNMSNSILEKYRRKMKSYITSGDIFSSYKFAEKLISLLDVKK